MPGRSVGLAAAAGLLLVAAGVALGCSAGTRHRVLSVFFDGVPAPAPPPSSDPDQAAGELNRRAAVLVEHGPYAARECSACHEPGATNALVAPREQLCQRCHDLDLDKRYVHGPLAAGGCGACHDPHSSRFRHLLVSDADEFCATCHDLSSLTPVEGHRERDRRCTVCHDPHMSDRQFLLR